MRSVGFRRVGLRLGGSVKLFAVSGSGAKALTTRILSSWDGCRVQGLVRV